MIDIGVFDLEFAHYPHTSLIPPQSIRWHKNEVLPICVFTDREIATVESVQCARKIAWLMEPRAYRRQPYEYVEKHLDRFDYVITHDRSILKLSPKCLFCNASATTWIMDQDQAIHPKSKLVSMITSGKTTTEGHRFRELIASVFQQSIDCFGPYQPNHLPQLHGKIAALRDYHFSVVMLNSDVDCFFTEAVVDAFRTGTIPIFWGTREITQHFHPNGILRFEDIDGFDSILKSLSPELYQSRIEAVKVNFGMARQYRAPEDWLVDRYPFLFTL